MKYFILVAIATLMLLVSQAQPSKEFAKKTEAMYKPIKGDSVFASACECSNSDYQLFLDEYRRKGDKQSLLANRPDSGGWNFKRIFPKNEGNNDAIAAVYNWHPAYRNYPVVNVSFYSALAYCEWLTRTYNASPGRKYKKVIFRMPDKYEWKYAAKGKTPANANTFEKRLLPWDGLTFKDKKGKYLANFAPLIDDAIKRDANYYLKVVDSIHFSAIGLDGYVYQAPCFNGKKTPYKPNEYGLYHMAGNVSEFILEEGKTKGGSFISPGYYLLIDTDESEFREELLGGPFIGFRPFMFVIER